MKKKINFLLLFAIAMSYVPLSANAQEETVTKEDRTIIEDTTVTTTAKPTIQPRLFGKGTTLKNFTLGVNGGVVLPAVLGNRNLTPDNKGSEPALGYGAYLGYALTQHLELIVSYQGAPHIKGKYNDEAYDTKLTAAIAGKLRLSTGGLSFLTAKPVVALFVQGGLGYAMYTPDFNSDKELGNQFSSIGGGMMIHLAQPISFVLGADMNFLQQNFMFVDPADGGIPSSKWSYVYAGLEVYFGGKGQAKIWYNPAKAMYDELSQAKSNDELDALSAKVAALSSKIDDLYKDTDGDGVPDYRDKEPNTAPGVQVDGAGRTIKFPETTTVIQQSTSNDMPDSTTNTAVTPGKKGTIQFAFDSSKLIGESDEAIRALVANELKGASKVILEGYTCDIGTEAYNKGLGKRRAVAVKRAMVKAGMNASKIETISYGEEHPAYPNTSRENRELNRRVEIKIQD